MKSVLNKSNRPLRVHLAGGKVLHLGPGKEGQISDHDVERAGVQKLVEAKELEIVDGVTASTASRGAGGSAHAETHGHHPAGGTHQRGDR